ncbi:MAG: DNA repair protein RecO [Spirochaetae bacterium HGW-Spirochaetae-9]|nr:MAG: DNA repair protein RecO [Spirochaetae bacterium HGW-Spirochaetae-9]
MPDRNTSFDALFLRSKDSPSGDRIATMLSSEEGIIDAFVFGGSRSSLRSSASPFVFAKVFIYSDPVKHYRKLSDMAIIESFTGLRDSYAKLWSASLIAELIVKTSGCGGEYAEVLDLSLQALRLFDRGNDEEVEMTLLAYLWKSLAVMGLQPDLERCAHCGKALAPAGSGLPSLRGGALYLPARDGFVCASCGEDGLSLGAGLEAGGILRLRDFSAMNLEACAKIQVQDAELSSLKALIYYMAQKAAEGSLLTLSTQ